MSSTPHRRRSRSRHATPTPTRPGTPSTTRPNLRTYNSIPSLALANVLTSTAAPPQLSLPDTAASTTTASITSTANPLVLESEPSSSAASIIGDHDGIILVKDADADTDTEVDTHIAEDIPESVITTQPTRSEEDAAADALRLRDQLRRSLSQGPGPSTKDRNEESPVPVNEEHFDDGYVEPQREFFVLTHAGKPVFSSRAKDDNVEDTNIVGVMHAIISVFEDDQDKIRCINAPPKRITFVLRPPLYYVCVSSIKEPESVVRIYLEHLHLLILSVLSLNQLQRILTKHTNFDLRRMLAGTTTLLHSHLTRLPTSPGILMASLHSMRLDPLLRTKIAETLIPPSRLKTKDSLYALLIVNDRVVTIARPRKHSIHPADLHVLLAIIAAPSIKNTPASWLPICLPKFNSSGFLHAYVSFIRSDEQASSSLLSIPPLQQLLPGNNQPNIALILISAAGDFENVRQWAQYTTDKLENAGTIDSLVEAAKTHEYAAKDIGIPGVRHFIYKSRTNVQVTMPKFTAEDGSEAEYHRIFALYRMAYDSIHARSGQDTTLKLQYIKTESVCVMGWITQPFELYLALSPKLPKSAAVSAANAIVRWIKKEDIRLFLRDAPVF